MKKLLIGTTALVATVGIASSVYAKDLSLKVGGNMRAGVGFGAHNEGITKQSDDFFILRDGEIQFTGQGTLDNGITITARIELDGISTGDQIDENWLEVETAFGSFLIGGNDNAGYNAGGIGYTLSILGTAAQDQTFGFTPASIGTISQTDNIAIHYYSPSIAGFEIGVSYANDVVDGPDGDAGSDNANDGDTATDTNDDQYAIGANYQNSFGDFDLAIGGSYIYSEVDNAIADADSSDQDIEETEWGVGVELGFAGFTLTGRYEDEDNEDGTVDTEITRYSGSLGYGTGPWNFVLGAAFEDTEVEGGDETEEFKIHGGAQYTLGDGVNVGAVVEYGSTDIESATGDEDEDGFGGALLLGVSF